MAGAAEAAPIAPLHVGDPGHVEYFDVLIVGAGLSGIGAAYHLQTKCPAKTYAILVGVHRCSCGYPPSPREGPALWETLKVATFAIPQSHSVDCKAERVRPGRCGNDTPIVPSASWRRSKTVTRNGRRTSPRRRGTSRLTAGTSGVRCCASKTPVGISRLYLCAARRHTPEL